METPSALSLPALHVLFGLLAYPFLLFSQLWGERGAEILRIEYLPNLNL